MFKCDFVKFIDKNAKKSTIYPFRIKLWGWFHFRDMGRSEPEGSELATSESDIKARQSPTNPHTIFNFQSVSRYLNKRQKIEDARDC